MDSKKQLLIRPEWDTNTFVKVLKLGSNEDYESLIAKISNQTGRKFPTECHLVVDGHVIDSHKSLQTILSQEKENYVQATLKV